MISVSKPKSTISSIAPRPSYLLPTIVVAQFAGTSLWFAGNAVIPNLQEVLSLENSVIGDVTTAVQLGFIAGTLVFAFLSIADRFSPVKVFLTCSLAGAAANLLLLWPTQPTLFWLLTSRFLTGFFLAGIYPVGMKISADWYEKGLGKALGFLVGALVIGTAFPHLVKQVTQSLPLVLCAHHHLNIRGLGRHRPFPFGTGWPFQKEKSRT